MNDHTEGNKPMVPAGSSAQRELLRAIRDALDAGHIPAPDPTTFLRTYRERGRIVFSSVARLLDDRDTDDMDLLLAAHSITDRCRDFQLTPEPSPAPGAPGEEEPGGPRRMLILDSTPSSPRWLLAMVQPGLDIRPAEMDVPNGRYTDWPEVCEWVRSQVGPVCLVPVSAIAWRVDEQPGGVR